MKALSIDFIYLFIYLILNRMRMFVTERICLYWEIFEPVNVVKVLIVADVY